ncbi:MAG: outer membrane protein assembly factor BamA, partial [Epsilonproteobacteria bacterium]
GLALGWSHDTLNRAVFPTDGGQQRVSAMATVPGSDLEYFKLSYKHQQYFPVARDVTIRLAGEVAYGDGYGDTTTLPFFENYFAGGVKSVRGYEDNTLGPRDSHGDPFGGAGKITAKAEMYFPVPFIDDVKSIRLGTFIDAGTVYDDFDTGEMKFSAGLSGEWLSPFGALAVSLAVPINAGDDDDTQSFQFSFGSGF